MRCPRCSEAIWAGDHQCGCGSYHFHEWTGGGVLIGALGTWTYQSSSGEWVPLPGGQTAVSVVPAPEAPTVPDKQVAPPIEVRSDALGRVLVFVQVQISGLPI